MLDTHLSLSGGVASVEAGVVALALLYQDASCGVGNLVRWLAYEFVLIQLIADAGCEQSFYAFSGESLGS